MSGQVHSFVHDPLFIIRLPYHHLHSSHSQPIETLVAKQFANKIIMFYTVSTCVHVHAHVHSCTCTHCVECDGTHQRHVEPPEGSRTLHFGEHIPSSRGPLPSQCQGLPPSQGQIHQEVRHMYNILAKYAVAFLCTNCKI